MVLQVLLVAVAVAAMLPLLPINLAQIPVGLVAATPMVKTEPLELLDKATLVEMGVPMFLHQILLTVVVVAVQVLLVAQGLLPMVEMAVQALQTQLLELLGCPQTLLAVVVVVVELQTVAAPASQELEDLQLGATAVHLVSMELMQS
jgi:hypothetical protein